MAFLEHSKSSFDQKISLVLINFYLINDLEDVWLLIGLSLLSLSASLMVALRCYRRMYPNIKTTSEELTLNPFRLSKYFFNILGKTGLDTLTEFVKALSIFEHV